MYINKFCNDRNRQIIVIFEGQLKNNGQTPITQMEAVIKKHLTGNGSCLNMCGTAACVTIVEWQADKIKIRPKCVSLLINLNNADENAIT